MEGKGSNIFKNAKFGDKFKTWNGYDAVYYRETPYTHAGAKLHELLVSGWGIKRFSENGTHVPSAGTMPSKILDIVLDGRPADRSVRRNSRGFLDLDELAREHAEKWYRRNIWGANEEWNKRCFKDGFKEGYHEANGS